MTDFKSISQTKDIFMNQPKDVWIRFCENFDTSIGNSARELINFINSKHVTSTYKYSGIDFDDFQRALPVILRNFDKIEKIKKTYDWHYICEPENLKKCAYLVFLWTLWSCEVRNDKIRDIYLNAKNNNNYAQNILNIQDICKWDDWSYVLDEPKSEWACSTTHTVFTDIIKKIQYPKILTDVNKAYVQEVLKQRMSGLFTCEQINILACYAYNNKLIGTLSTHEGDGITFSIMSSVYSYDDNVCWFNPPKPSDKKINLFGSFQFNNPNDSGRKNIKLENTFEDLNIKKNQ